MRKRIAILALISFLFIPLSMSHVVYANTIDEVIEQSNSSAGSSEYVNEKSEDVLGQSNEDALGEQSSSSNYYDNGSSDESLNLPKSESTEQFSNSLSDSTNFTGETYETTKQVSNKINSIVAPLIQIVVYLIMVMMILRVILDIIYIVFPPSRAFLSNGRTGNPLSQGTMTGNTTGGMYSGANNMMMQQETNPSNASNIQWVSQAAMNAVASESVQGPNGKASNPLKVYAKDEIVLFITVPILLILAVTGILSKLGFALASLISGIIESIIVSL